MLLKKTEILPSLFVPNHILLDTNVLIQEHECLKWVHIIKYAKIQCTIQALKSVQKLSAKQQSLYTLNKCHNGDVVEVESWG